jgi:cytochrome b involved in lipid metabolism
VNQKDQIVTLDLGPYDRCQAFVECEQSGRFCETKKAPKFKECLDCIKECQQKEESEQLRCRENCHQGLGIGIPALSAFSLEEVAKHDNKNDCYMALNGKVYNPTEFINSHPGGGEILEGCGKDATTLFETRPTGSKTPHSSSARAILEDYYIGDLEE